MHLLDARRLTGKNLVWDHPGAVADVRLDPAEAAAHVAEIWTPLVRATLDAVGWEGERATALPRLGGIVLAISAPIDALYAAVEVLEWSFLRLVQASGQDPTGAWADAADEDEDADERRERAAALARDPAGANAEAARRLRGLIAAERNPALLALCAAAQAHGVAFLSDDDEASVGLGRGSATWPVDALPQRIDWSAIHDIPVGIVTGTNGKTTTVRLIAQMIRAAGLNAGMSSTDWMGVNDTILDRGDYSGPGGARAVLRRREVDVAILETARGGLLRRGLGVAHADAALITNIGEDHLGDFGSRSLAELLDIKWTVTRALGRHGRAVLNADDALLASRAGELRCPITWFTTHPPAAALRAHVAAGGHAAWAEGGRLCIAEDGEVRAITDVAAVPITLGGAARHNVANALAAIAVSRALGLADGAIRDGLHAFTAERNPGRCNLFHVDGVDVLLDFAHNPDGMAAVFDVASLHPAGRRALCFSQAGDRPDENIRDLARAAWRIGLDRVVISELPAYRRGRAPGEVYAILRDALIAAGADPAIIAHHHSELESLRDALAWARPGDLVIMLGLGEQQALLAELRGRSGTAS